MQVTGPSLFGHGPDRDGRVDPAADEHVGLVPSQNRHERFPRPELAQRRGHPVLLADVYNSMHAARAGS